MLHPGVVLTVDGGGMVAAPIAALEGASEAGRYLCEVLGDKRASLVTGSVNGAPGIVVHRDAKVTGVLGIRVRGRVIVEAWLVLNPGKLERWNR